MPATHLFFFVLIAWFLIALPGFGQDKQLKNDIATIDKFLKKNKITAIQHESGLRYVISESGEGADKPTVSSTITVRYVGMLMEGNKIFDEAPNPVDFPLSRLIKGWQIGFQQLTKGSMATFYVPSGLAYGAKGAGEGVIPPNANLVFVVELIDFQ